MERGSNKQNPMVDDEMKDEAEPLERSGKESHVEEHLVKEEPAPDELAEEGGTET